MSRNTDRESVVRAVTLPVATVENAEWPDFLTAAHAAWSLSTSLANWAVRQLAKAERERRSTDKKLWKSPSVYLYGQLAHYHDRAAWDGCMSSAQCILRGVEKKYRKRRFDMIWRNAESYPSMRYPQPFPIHNKDWKPSCSEDDRGAPMVSVRLPGVAERLMLRLRCGPEFRRQLTLFRLLESGEAKCGEAVLYAQGCSGNTGRRKGIDRSPGGGQKQPFTVLLKLVGHFPIGEKKPSDRVMIISTDPSALWVAEVDDRPAWIYNADHVRRWVMAHACARQRFSEDLKHERRWPKRERIRMKEALAKRCDKNNRRLDSFVHEATAMAANFAARQKCGLVVYNDEQKGYLPSFPWFVLRERLKDKLKAHGIEMKARAEVDTGVAT